jgi:dTDP-4-amino-4,6-dideoxygalactose transaminase
MFPVAEKCADEFISLPMFAELTPEQVAIVGGKVKAWFQNSTKTE